jgi:hypothetical protein
MIAPARIYAWGQGRVKRTNALATPRNQVVHISSRWGCEWGLF